MSNVNICGRREEGKTTLAMWLAKKKHAGVIAFDPRGMISGIVVWDADELENAINEKVWRDGPIVCRSDSENVQEEFTNICKVLFPPRFTRGAFGFVVDEAGYLQTAHSIHPELLRVVKQHPTFPSHHSVTIIQTNHRLAEFHGASKALMNDLYIFQTSHPRDLQALEDHTGSSEVVGIVRELPRFHCVRYKYGRQPDGVSQYEIWDNPEERFLDISGKSQQMIQQSPHKEGWFV